MTVAEEYEKYLKLCHFPFLQDESCNLPAGHSGEHRHINSITGNEN